VFDTKKKRTEQTVLVVVVVVDGVVDVVDVVVVVVDVFVEADLASSYVETVRQSRGHPWR